MPLLIGALSVWSLDFAETSAGRCDRPFHRDEERSVQGIPIEKMSAERIS
jgi:hypothetical protein